jgi:hypothetical protein
MQHPRRTLMLSLNYRYYPLKKLKNHTLVVSINSASSKMLFTTYDAIMKVSTEPTIESLGHFFDDYEKYDGCLTLQSDDYIITINIHFSYVSENIYYVRRIECRCYNLSGTDTIPMISEKPFMYYCEPNVVDEDVTLSCHEDGTNIKVTGLLHRVCKSPPSANPDYGS